LIIKPFPVPYTTIDPEKIKFFDKKGLNYSETYAELRVKYVYPVKIELFVRIPLHYIILKSAGIIIFGYKITISPFTTF
jgi:hypothetical protein